VIRQVDGLVSLDPLAIHVRSVSRVSGIPALVGLSQEGISFQSGNLTNSKRKSLKPGSTVSLSSEHEKLYAGRLEYH